MMLKRDKDLLEIFNDNWINNHNKRKKEDENAKSSIPVKPTVEAKRISDQIEKTIKFEKQNEVKRFAKGYKND